MTYEFISRSILKMLIEGDLIESKLKIIIGLKKIKVNSELIVQLSIDTVLLKINTMLSWIIKSS
jgi:hypothetical protein